jgi:hypothetical protein
MVLRLVATIPQISEDTPDSSVGTPSRLQAGGPEESEFNFRQGHNFGRGVELTSSCSVQAKIAWSYTTTSPYVRMT